MSEREPGRVCLLCDAPVPCEEHGAEYPYGLVPVAEMVRLLRRDEFWLGMRAPGSDAARPRCDRLAAAILDALRSREAHAAEPDAQRMEGWAMEWDAMIPDEGWSFAEDRESLRDGAFPATLIVRRPPSDSAVPAAALRAPERAAERIEGVAFKDGDAFCNGNGEDGEPCQRSWTFVPECEHESADTADLSGGEFRATLIVHAAARPEPIQENENV